MVQVIHVLRDGTILDDITGHVVQYEDAEPVYHLMQAINAGKEVIENETDSP